MRRVAIFAATILVGLSSSVMLGSAAGDRSVTIRGTERFVPNTLINADFRFSPGPLSVKSGDSVTWNNTTNDGHSISIVDSQPATIQEVFGCGAPGTPCAPILQCHFPNGFGAPPVIDCGNAGNGELKASGDSFLIGCDLALVGCQVPLPTTRTMRVTAPAGTRLLYMCVIHPWMQGEIDVN